MLYHVIRRPLHNNNTTNSSNQSRNNRRSGSVPPSTLMPRYHYSRTTPNSATNQNSDLILTRNHFDGLSSKPTMTATTTATSNNNNNTNTNQNSPYGSFKSTVIPLVTNNRTTTPNKREFIQIPITREDGSSNTTTTQIRSVPVTFITDSNPSSPTGNKTNGNISPRPPFISLVRPSSRYFQYHFNNATEEPSLTSNVPRLPSVSRRLSLTIPITSTNLDEDPIKQSIPSSPTRQIPIRLPQTTSTTIISPNSSNTSRIYSAVQRTSPIPHVLQRQKTDISDISSPTIIPVNHQSQQSSSDFNLTSPIRRAESMAREAIQGMIRYPPQRTHSLTEKERSPTLSRRVIINLKNNQSVSLDSRLSSAMKPPPIPSSSRLNQRNNLYHIPILHEIQMTSPTATTILSETTTLNNNYGNFKNEFHMEIPVQILTTNDQENLNERISSANNNNHNTHQTLKSILKRSSSRETVSRKNVSFMNA